MADLQQLIELTETMLAEAFNGQWPVVTELQAVRMGKIQDYFSHDIMLPNSEIESGVQKILALDKQLLELAAERKARVKEELSGIIQGKNRVKAYAAR